MSEDRDVHSYGDFAALVGFVREFGSASGEPAGDVRQSRCGACGATTFWMQCSEEDGVALRTCTGCKSPAFIGDSEVHWSDADTGDAACPCGKKVFEMAVGFCVQPDDNVDWIVVGGRCVTCDLIGVYADWGIDFTPSAALRELG